MGLQSIIFPTTLWGSSLAARSEHRVLSAPPLPPLTPPPPSSSPRCGAPTEGVGGERTVREGACGEGRRAPEPRPSTSETKPSERAAASRALRCARCARAGPFVDRGQVPWATGMTAREASASAGTATTAEWARRPGAGGQGGVRAGRRAGGWTWRGLGGCGGGAGRSPGGRLFEARKLIDGYHCRHIPRTMRKAWSAAVA